MRTWLTKFRVSLALDASDLPPENRGDKDAPQEIKPCAESMLALDHQLRAAERATPIPAALHASVMRAVRASTDSEARQHTPWVLRWWPAPALAMLVAFGLWFVSRSPQESPSLTAPATALEQGHDMAQKAPEIVLAPLAQEMNNLNRDFKNAVEFLVASVP